MMKTKLFLVLMLMPFMFACNKNKNTDATEKSSSELIVGEWYLSSVEYYDTYSGQTITEEVSREEAELFYMYTDNGVAYICNGYVDWNYPDDTFYWSIEDNILKMGNEEGVFMEEWNITFEGNDKFYLENTLYSPTDENYEKNAYQRM